MPENSNNFGWNGGGNSPNSYPGGRGGVVTFGPGGTPLNSNTATAQDYTPAGAATNTAAAAAAKGPAIYGNGHQTLGEFQQWQADESNKGQLAGQAAFNKALSEMPAGTIGDFTNPYDQYVKNPATPGVASSALTSPANTANWWKPGMASQMVGRQPTAEQIAAQKVASQPSSLSTGNTFAGGGQPDYQRDQLTFLLRALQGYGNGGQNSFGNSFSSAFGGRQAGGFLDGTMNGASNPGGYQSNSGGNGNNFNIAQILPLLIGLAGGGQGGGGGYSQGGSYGSLGGGYSQVYDPYRDTRRNY